MTGTSWQAKSTVCGSTQKALMLVCANALDMLLGFVYVALRCRDLIRLSIVHVDYGSVCCQLAHHKRIYATILMLFLVVLYTL